MEKLEFPIPNPSLLALGSTRLASANPWHLPFFSSSAGNLRNLRRGGGKNNASEIGAGESAGEENREFGVGAATPRVQIPIFNGIAHNIQDTKNIGVY